MADPRPDAAPVASDSEVRTEREPSPSGRPPNDPASRTITLHESHAAAPGAAGVGPLHTGPYINKEERGHSSFQND